MKTSRTVTARARVVAMAVIAIMAITIAPSGSWAAGGQLPGGSTPEAQVAIVQTVGCVEQRGGTEWWLTRASDPTESRAGIFTVIQVDEAKEAALGSAEFQLIGVADFLSAEGLLQWGDRAEFTSPAQANASGELRPGRTVLVKGLLIEADEVTRINLMGVVGLDNTCG